MKNTILFYANAIAFFISGMATLVSVFKGTVGECNENIFLVWMFFAIITGISAVHFEKLSAKEN